MNNGVYSPKGGNVRRALFGGVFRFVQGVSLGDITILSNIAVLIWKRFLYLIDLVLIEISMYRDISRYRLSIAIS